MLHVTAALFFSSVMAVGLAVIGAMLAQEREAILNALMMRAAGAPAYAGRPVRVTQVRYAARIRPQVVRQAAFRVAA